MAHAWSSIKYQPQQATSTRLNVTPLMGHLGCFTSHWSVPVLWNQTYASSLLILCVYGGLMCCFVCMPAISLTPSLWERKKIKKRGHGFVYPCTQHGITYLLTCGKSVRSWTVHWAAQAQLAMCKFSLRECESATMRDPRIWWPQRQNKDWSAC